MGQLGAIFECSAADSLDSVGQSDVCQLLAIEECRLTQRLKPGGDINLGKRTLVEAAAADGAERARKGDVCQRLAAEEGAVAQFGYAFGNLD